MLDELMKQRIEKIEELKKSGICVYPSRFLKQHSVAWIKENFKENEPVACAGRIMGLRSHGKSIFGDLKDNSGRVQFYIKKDIVGEDGFLFAKKLDIGDIAGIHGELFMTHTQEPTILVKEIKLLAKAIRSLPEKWHGLKDVEIRYRKRYLDLIANDAVKDVFILRSKLIKNIRKYLDEHGYLEVETPMMHSLAGGAAGKPFKTHLDALSIDLFLRIAPELYLKKLLVGDLERVYEINRSFRNEGISTRHNPEFTMLEVYTAYADYRDMMELTKGIILSVADEVLGKREITFHEQAVDLNTWENISFAELMRERFDINPDDSEADWLAKLKQKNIKVELKEGKISRTFILNLISDLIEVKSAHPVFITDIYTELCPLAKKKADNPLLSERFELFIGGMEVANAYSELNDPREQRERFLQQAKDEGECKIDEDFIEALEYGMPPAGGLGIGIDRLVMLFSSQPCIKDVILFPQLKPELEKDNACR
ncbi:MAG: lysine--tRNA ligase [Candidatus Omnitrophica bacterium]|nr:lysine--tRNA ligase [Candidatus Omnitrophota bacterium]MBU4479136.1 lysine--tRNA ligase [Candidatus Omnitrophota bacterium]MCG2702775.1 lysine--tRNA ligase [Candidatus Omnitrophota bacterium]